MQGGETGSYVADQWTERVEFDPQPGVAGVETPGRFEERIAGGEETPDLVRWETVTDSQGAAQALDLFTTDDELRLVHNLDNVIERMFSPGL